MMGHRGCRLCVTFPEIAVMQTKAVIRAAINVQRKHKAWNVKPEIMIPLTSDAKEFKFVKDIVVHTANEEINMAGINLSYEVGTMIEIPRAALLAGEIADEAQFFCFGTNDLTQMTYGFSRDDSGKFLNAYYDKKIFENDPFAKLDQVGVGKLMKMAIELGKGVRQARAPLRHLRRARRRPDFGRVLPPDRPRLRLLLAVPRADRAPRGGPGGAAQVVCRGHVPPPALRGRAGIWYTTRTFQKGKRKMKSDIHPKYEDATITCACGKVFHTRSTKKEMTVNTCSACHPYFTGAKTMVDTEGRVDSFKKRYAKFAK